MPGISQAVHGIKGTLDVSDDAGVSWIDAGEVSNMQLNRGSAKAQVTNRKTSVTAGGVGWEESKVFLNNWTATAEINYVHSEEALVLMSGAYQSQTALKYRFRPETGAGYLSWEGYAYLDINLDMPIGSQIMASISLAGQGELEEEEQV